MGINNLTIIPFKEDFKWQVYMITNKKRQQEKSVKQLIEFSKKWMMETVSSFV